MSKATNAVPNPGSDEAIRRGCSCPVLDNGHGRGWMGRADLFVYTVGCPVHCPTDDGLVRAEKAEQREAELRGER